MRELVRMLILGTLFSVPLVAQQPPPDTPTCPFKEPREDCKTLPRAIYSPNPMYSEYARKHRLRGTVLLSVVVQPDGTADDVKVSRSLEQSLDAKAIEAVRTWRFEPSRYAGHAIAYPLTIEVTFKLY